MKMKLYLHDFTLPDRGFQYISMPAPEVTSPLVPTLQMRLGH